jgi:hypothetical protein
MKNSLERYHTHINHVMSVTANFELFFFGSLASYFFFFVQSRVQRCLDQLNVVSRTTAEAARYCRFA